MLRVLFPSLFVFGSSAHDLRRIRKGDTLNAPTLPSASPCRLCTQSASAASRWHRDLPNLLLLTTSLRYNGAPRREGGRGGEGPRAPRRIQGRCPSTTPTATPSPSWAVLWGPRGTGGVWWGPRGHSRAVGDDVLLLGGPLYDILCDHGVRGHHAHRVSG